jgi:hypothetical protein
MYFISMRFILREAIAACRFCHQRNAVFGSGTCIFILTHFLHVRRNTRRVKDGAGFRSTTHPSVVGKVEAIFRPGTRGRTMRLRMTPERRRCFDG